MNGHAYPHKYPWDSVLIMTADWLSEVDDADLSDQPDRELSGTLNALIRLLRDEPRWWSA